MDGDGAGDYWDLDAILAQQSRVRCHMAEPAYGFAFLAGSKDTVLPKGAVVELPFWLAESLGVAGIAGLEMPACFGEQVQAELTASPESLQLSLLAPDFFYFFADYLRIMEIDKSVTELVSRSFKHRLRILSDFAFAARLGPENSSFLRTLDATEKRLYDLCSISAEAQASWLRRDHTRKGSMQLQRLQQHQLQHQQRGKRRRVQ